MLTTCKSQSRRQIFGYFMRTIVVCSAVCASILLVSLNGWTAGSEISTMQTSSTAITREIVCHSCLPFN